jgi:purine-binding chemotaxis protein CheW
MTRAQQTLDWREAYGRLARARQALDAGLERTPEEARRILAARARALAQPIEDVPTPDEVVDLLVFSLAGERYAVAAASVLEVIPLRELVTVPGAPRVVLGIVNHRGRILPVLDLRRVFELAGESVTERSRVVVAEAGGLTFGVFADAVAGVVRVGPQELEARPTGLVGGHQTFVLTVTRDMVAVVDLEALARDPRITVNEEIG